LTRRSLFGDLSKLTEDDKETILDKMRKGLHVVWKRKVERDFVEWFHGSEHRYDDREDIWAAGMRACVHARRSDWWDWGGGSTIFFWRWPRQYMDKAMVGDPPYFVGDPPESMEKQPAYTDKDTQAKVRSKVQAVMDKGYIVRCSPTEIRSLMFMFDVPKGEDDV
jgi:hypothetical protein